MQSISIWCVLVLARYATYALALSPLAFVAVVVALNKINADPEEEDEELKKLVDAIASSEWATTLASRMATTPEARAVVAKVLATRVARSFFKELKTAK